jgi:hypothetical protein
VLAGGDRPEHHGRVIPLDTATRLRDAGLTWKPAPGDRFAIPDRGLDDDVFVISHMTIEVHDMPEGQVIGFNGTTQWALDDLDKDEAIWLPREDQLRELLGPAFERLDRVGDRYRVLAEVAGTLREFVTDTAEAAYGEALLALVTSG